MLPTYQRISGPSSQSANPLLSVRCSFRSSEKCLILLVLLTFGFVCFGGFFFLPDNFGAERVLKVYKQFQKAGPEIFIPPPPPAHGLLDGDEDPHKQNDREKLQEKIQKELPDDFLEKPDLDKDRTAGPEFDNALDEGVPAAGQAGPMAGGPDGVVAPPQILEEPQDLKGAGGGGGASSQKGFTSGSSAGFHTFNSSVGEDPDPAVREKRNKVKENAGELLNRLIPICTQGQNPSAELVRRYKNGDFPNDRNTHCMMRCIALNLGVYDDLNGIHMRDTWRMFRADRSASEEKIFAEEHYKCIADQTKNVPTEDYCGRVYAIYQCYRQEYQALLQQGTAKLRN